MVAMMLLLLRHKQQYRAVDKMRIHHPLHHFDGGTSMMMTYKYYLSRVLKLVETLLLCVSFFGAI